MDTVIQILNIVPIEAWQAIIIGIISSPLSVPLIKWLHVHRDGLKLLTVLIMTTLGTFVAYMNTQPTIVANNKYLALGMVVAQALVAFSFSQFTWYGATKPLRSKVSQAWSSAIDLNKTKSSAKVGDDGALFSKS